MGNPDAVVLAVDDEPDILTVVKQYLEGAMPGVQVLTAARGAEGLEVLARQKVDLILSDFRMPEMNGLEFLRKAALLHPTVPRMLLTAFPDMDLAIEAVNQARVDHFLIKPPDPEELISAVRTSLDRSIPQEIRREAFRRSIELMRRRGTLP